MLTLEFFAAQVISTGALNNQLALVSGFTGVFFFFFSSSASLHFQPSKTSFTISFGAILLPSEGLNRIAFSITAN
jgi:hypothetical protein